MADTVNWSGYTFKVYYPNTEWNDVAGIYIFTGLNTKNLWVALYIGQTNSFANRLPSHERWPEAVRLGATHIHAMAVARQGDRDIIESRLIQDFQPPMNDQLK